MGQPLVSVAIFTHDHEPYVGRCVESFLAQGFGPDELEIVAVDDASSDGTWPALQRYRGVPHVRELVRHERNLGAPRTYADGTALARGRYLVPVDGDDYASDPRAVAKCFALMESSADIGFVHSGYELVDAAGRRLGVRLVNRRTSVATSRDTFRRLLLGNTVHHSGTMIRREHFAEAGGYNTALLNSVDWELWLRISAKHGVAYVAEPLYAYRLHPGNLHLTRLRVVDVQMREIFDVIDRAARYGAADEDLRRHARAAAYLLGATAQLASFETRRGLRYLGSAFETDLPWSLRQPQLYRGLLRLVASVLLRRRGYEALRRVRDWYRVRRHGLATERR